MKKIAMTAIILLFSASNTFAANIERLFYLTPDTPESSFSAEQLQKIKNHAKSIDIIAPQIYRLDENGVIWGNIDARLLAVAKENNLNIMPLVINLGFNQAQFHNFLHNPLAQERAILKMLSLCEQYHFYGLQFDFENININDKSEFTRFCQLTANQLHQGGFTMSIAVVPRISDVFYSTYDRWLFENWSGAYDYQALGQSSDFISVMSYDQHTSLTTPGPIATIDWVEKTIQSLLRVVPAKKISLGIPSYSGYWSTGKLDPGNIPEMNTYRSKETQIGYSRALNLLAKFNQSLIWQDQWKSSYIMYNNDEKNEYLFVEDAKSFQAKLELVERYQLRGISVWRLGLEDPAIWENQTLI
ncbi:MAG TPA: glycosyl hydrolase family 18 protein [Gammaproteobacteria bacterium]|nr:glycosyl hydrolase family 18 protein [Gammaproteobacteria bacterium]